MYKIFKISIIFFVLCTFLLKVNIIYAIEDPLAVSNNRFGIHIFAENDLLDAVRLVNSSGGDWGYVTFVIREDERDKSRWQRVFNNLRLLHLIPIIRIASSQEEYGWKELDVDDIENWISFLNSLNWVIKNRYLVIGNEPNHASEWGGQINPEKYTDYLIKFSIASKSASDDFFILPAGLDSSAPNSDVTMREEDFIKNMINAHPNVFDYIDGWTSHSYPNPDFSGSANDIGKGSIKTYQWEISLLKSLGFEKDLPIFITETGWAHNGDSENNHYQSTDEISSNFIKAFNQIWTEKNIVAVTPFILNYQAEPFNKFSWKKSDKEFYDFFYKVENISKNKGEPVQINSWDILANLQTEVNSFGNIIGISLVKNTGQRIWKKNEIFEIKINEKKYKINSIFFDYVEPKETSLMFYIITPE